MATYTLTDITNGFVGSAEVYKKKVLQWNIRKLGIQVRTNVNTPQALAKFDTDNGPQPYRKQDDFNGATIEDRVLTAYQAKYDQELDPEDFRNEYLADLPEMPFEEYAIDQGGKKFLDSLMTSTLWLGVRNASGTAAVDICDGWGTILAAAIAASDVTEVAGAAVTSSNAVTQVELVADAVPAWMKESEEGFIVMCSYGTLEKYRKHYRTLNAFGFNKNEQGQYKLDGINAVLMPCAFMGTSQRIIATMRNNFVLGTDTEQLRTYPTRHLNLLRNRILFPVGCQIKDLAALQCNDQA